MKSLVRNPNRLASELLFGTKLQPVCGKELSKRTGIAESTLCGYRKNPGSIRLERLGQIAWERKLTPEQVGNMVLEYRKVGKKYEVH